MPAYKRIDENPLTIRRLAPSLRLLLRAGIELPLAPLRCTNAAAMLIHGLGHALALFLMTGDKSSFSVHIIAEGVSLSDLAKACCRFSPSPSFPEIRPTSQPS